MVDVVLDETIVLGICQEANQSLIGRAYLLVKQERRFTSRLPIYCYLRRVRDISEYTFTK
jgi:hypothetical protein